MGMCGIISLDNLQMEAEMRRFSISELDARALELALGRGLGLEIIGFCTAERM